MFRKRLPAMLTLALLGLTRGGAAEPTVRIDATKAAGPVSPMMYGLMTEEINHSYDGGLYAELIHNRAFLDDRKEPTHWSAVQVGESAATIKLDPTQPLSEALLTSLHLEVTKASADHLAGVANEGFWGIPVMPNTDYRATFYAKAPARFTGSLTVAIQSDDGKTNYTSAKSEPLTDSYKKYELVLHTGDLAATSKARFTLLLDQPGNVWFTFVSLFPPTFKDQPNGFRKDLMQMLVDLHPKFLRLPGGNYVEGNTIDSRFAWKKTIGPLTDRAGHPGCWGYRSSDGMGLLEFLMWCEDMGAEPVLAVPAGYALNGSHIEAGPFLQPFVDESLEEIEYVSGDANTTWGARRAKDGHPEPFPLHYVEIGNEDFFDKSKKYDSRFAQFYDAIRAKYPKLKIISSVGNEQAKAMVTSRVPDVVDEHYYRPAEEFISASPDYYEKYQRATRPDIFVGEWASYEDPKIKPWEPAAKKQPPTPSFIAALGDACWMAAMERNTDLVQMNCYAPMLVNVNPGAYQWRPDLIGYDALHVFGSPSYYAIKMFSTNVGDERLPITLSETSVQASVTRDSKSGTIYLKLVNPTASESPVKIELKGANLQSTARVTTMAAEPAATNSIDHPDTVLPKDSELKDVTESFAYPVAAHSISVIQLRSR